MAVYYNKEKQDDRWVCRDNAALWEGPFGKEEPDFPIKIGPYEAQPWMDCFYQQDTKTQMGRLQCRGAGPTVDGVCRGATTEAFSCHAQGKDIVWRTLVYCTIEPPNPPPPPPPAPAKYCFNSTNLGVITLETGAKETLIDYNKMVDLIKDSCNHAKNWVIDKTKDLDGNPKVRLALDSANVDPKAAKWDKKVCNDNFVQLLRDCMWPSYRYYEYVQLTR